MLGDPRTGRTQRCELVGAQEINEVLSYARHMVRGCFDDCIPSVIGENSKRSSAIIGAGLAAHKSLAFHPIYLVGEPAARGEGLIRKIAHTNAPLGRFGKLHQDDIVGNGQAMSCCEFTTELFGQESGGT